MLVLPFSVPLIKEACVGELRPVPVSRRLSPREDRANDIFIEVDVHLDLYHLSRVSMLVRATFPPALGNDLCTCHLVEAIG